jgi:hypothetical protein
VDVAVGDDLDIAFAERDEEQHAIAGASVQLFMRRLACRKYNLHD